MNQNSIVIYYIQPSNGKKYYLDVRGNWTTQGSEAQLHYEFQFSSILNDHPSEKSLYNCQYELA